MQTILADSLFFFRNSHEKPFARQLMAAERNKTKKFLLNFLRFEIFVYCAAIKLQSIPCVHKEARLALHRLN